MYDFHMKDLDIARVHARALEEAKKIYAKETTRRNRSMDEVLRTTMLGHFAECHLIDNCGWHDDSRPFRDVISPRGEPVDCKVATKESNVWHLLNRLAMENGWKKVQYVAMWVNDGPKYKFYGFYSWNGMEFIPFEWDTQADQDRIKELKDEQEYLENNSKTF